MRICMEVNIKGWLATTLSVGYQYSLKNSICVVDTEVCAW